MNLPKRVRDFFSIENEILLPFVFISIIAILALFYLIYGSQSEYWKTGGVASAFYEQRYLILGSIALLLIIVQTAVLVAYNIAHPIRELAELCERVSMNPGVDHESVPEMEEYVMRLDEVGQLAAAFTMMMGSLGRYTQELTLLKAMNESIVENLPLGLIVCDPEGKVIFRNTQADMMLGRTEETDETGRNLQDIVEAKLAKNEILPEPVMLHDPSGKVRHLEFGSWKLPDADNNEVGFLFTIDDVTYKRRMEEKASQDEKLAYTGQLAAEVAHEAKNPLAGIRAGLQVIERRLPEDRDRQLCGEMIREVDRVNLLVENMVNLARKRESMKTTVDLNGLFDELMLLYLKIGENKGIMLRTMLTGRIWLVADEQELRQILINLINNSLKAMPSGGELLLSGRKTGQGVEVAVRDTGTGMSEETQARVLRGEGGGLGLSIVRRLVTRNGGKMHIDSAEGKGTCVTLTFRGVEQEEKNAV